MFLLGGVHSETGRIGVFMASSQAEESSEIGRAGLIAHNVYWIPIFEGGSWRLVACVRAVILRFDFQNFV